VSYKESEEETVAQIQSNDAAQQQAGRKRKLKSMEDEVSSKKVTNGPAGVKATQVENGTGTKCLLCAAEVEGGLKEARFHYTICLLNEGSFSLLEEYKDNGQAGDRVYTCLLSGEGCTKKKYNHRNFCIHMATSHGFDSVAQIMARHPHPGMKSVLASLFPDHPLVKESSATEDHLMDSQQDDDLTLEETSAPPAPEPNPVVVQKPLVLKPSGLPRGKPGPKPKSVKQGMTNNGRPGSPAANPKISTFFSPSRSAAVLPSEEEEQVDQPSEPDLPKQKQRGPASRTTGATAAAVKGVAPATVKPLASQSGLSSIFQNYIATAAAAPVPSGPPKVFPEKLHTCQVCKGQGAAGKEGRSLKRGPVHLSTTLYHYAACFYTEANLAFMVDPGKDNVRQKDGTQDEYGQRFKYKCPYTECEKNTGRKIAQMGFKEYAIHIAVRHHFLESLMYEIKTPEMADMLEEVIATRHAKGEQVVEIPEVVVEELHTCLICEGETKDGRDLSFQGMKRAGLRYHYASCLYDSNIYLAKYPPGEANQDAEGQVKDVMGAEMKYQCSSNGCSVARKRKQMGYKEHCIHMSNEHGGLEEVLAEHSRPEVRAVAAKLEATK